MKPLIKFGFNKTAGIDDLTIEHIKYAHPSLIKILAKCFDIYAHCGSVPDDFGRGVMKPIPKFKGVKKNCNVDDFRGITICSIISKIFEHCILRHFNEITTSIRQFGFKKNSSCHMAIYSVKRVINYFNDRGSTVAVGSIDLRKAFDKVNHYGLLCTLQQKHINARILDLLENWMEKSNAVIDWMKTVSAPVACSAGVRQGSVLSPVLFSLFVDSVLERLKSSGLGCIVNFECHNSFMYADDLILLSNSVTDMQAMFNLCAELFHNLDLPINLEKCHWMRIGPRHNSTCAPLFLNNTLINCVSESKFLGSTFCSGKKLCWGLNELKNKFYRNANMILGRIGNTSCEHVILKLIKTQGLQTLLYGVTASDLASSELGCLDFAYNGVFVKVFNVKTIENIRLCQFYSGNLTFSHMYELQRYKFLKTMLELKILVPQSSIDAREYRDYCNIKCKYNLDDKDSSQSTLTKFWIHFKSTVI